jgi:DNA mismatch repair protein MutS
MALVKEYFDLTLKYEKEYGKQSLLLMQVGSFFEVYAKKKGEEYLGSNIKEFSRICDLNIVAKSGLNKVSSDSTYMAGFKDIMIDKYLKKMTNAGYTTVVYTQDINGKNTTRSCSGIFSPGTHFIEDTPQLSNNIVCIWLEKTESQLLKKGPQIAIGIACIDIFTGKSVLQQFYESYLNSPTTYDQLEHFLSLHKPAEIIMVSNFDLSEMEQIIRYLNLSNIKTKLLSSTETENAKLIKNAENLNYQKEVIQKYFPNKFELIFENHYGEVPIAGYIFLLNYVCNHNPNLVKLLEDPQVSTYTDKLYLANYSLKQLHILEDGNEKGKYSCVINMLNECKTAMGKRFFKEIIGNPSTDESYLQKEYDIIEEVMNLDKSRFDFIRTNMGKIKDLNKIERQMICLKKISPRNLIQLIENVIDIKETLKEVETNPLIQNYFHTENIDINKILKDCNDIYDFIEEKIDFNVARNIDQIQGFETNFIKKGVNDKVDQKVKELVDSENTIEFIRNILDQLIPEKTKGRTTELVKINETEKNNFTLVSTNRRCKLLELEIEKRKSTEYILPNGERFVLEKDKLEYKKHTQTNYIISNPIVDKICKKIGESKIYLKAEIEIAYYNILDTFLGFNEKISHIVRSITLLDVMFNKAHIARKYNYCKPEIKDNDKSFFAAKGLRHCIIEQIVTDELYIPNDVSLGKYNTDGILLYGTNAVGKTSLIRSIGIAIILAQSGLYVPAASFEYKPYEYIFTRILSNDNLFRGLSTFEVEMTELRTIFKLYNKNSLILGDELCSGTEIQSAIGIFVSSILRFIEAQSSFIFATHLHQILELEEIKDINCLKVNHMEVRYNIEERKLVYNRKLKEGAGDSLYGLEVCKSLFLPNDLLDSAFEIRNKYFNEHDILSYKKSNYNREKVIGICEKCNLSPGIDVHHLIHQREANKSGIINTSDLQFHKNHKANLMVLCEKCHHLIHKEHKKGSKRVKTSKGIEIMQIL